MMRPGPNNVPAVRECLRKGSGMRKCGRDSIYEGFARRASASGCMRICWSIEDVNGSEGVYMFSVSASVGAEISAINGEMVGWMARKKPVEVKIRARAESLRMRMLARERGGGGGVWVWLVLVALGGGGGGGG